MTKAGLHCHSTASPDAATPPDEVYALAKSRGMDFVTLTDHDAIDGAVALAQQHDDAFVSVELTCAFRGEAQRVHVLCWGVTPVEFEELRRLSSDVEGVAAYLADHAIANALAHPYFTVAAPLTAHHRRRLARLFGAWETRNGARAAELNAPAAIWADTH